MSWNKFFGSFEHQDDGAQSQAQRKAALAEMAKREKVLQTSIDKRRGTINAYEAEIAPVFMQYRKLAADPRTAAAAKKLFKEKISPLEKRMATEERELKIDQMLLETGSRVRTKDNSGDVRGAYLQAMQAYTPFVGQQAGRMIDGDKADNILSSLTEAQLTLGTSDSTLAQSLTANMARLNDEEALDESEASAADTEDRTEESVLARLNARFHFDEVVESEPATPVAAAAATSPAVSASSSSATTRTKPQPSSAASATASTTTTYRGASELSFPQPSTALPNARPAARAVGSGRQAVASSIASEGGKPRSRHTTFDTDD